jgi:hypothetical protein
VEESAFLKTTVDGREFTRQACNVAWLNDAVVLI